MDCRRWPPPLPSTALFVGSGAVGTRLQGANILVTIDDRFHIGSDTNAMTATLAGILVYKGRLSWTSTIGFRFPRNIRRTPAPQNGAQEITASCPPRIPRRAVSHRGSAVRQSR
jgi:CubicO group peptidase (beta-lactamase class C family)